jgi:hypothetical protein
MFEYITSLTVGTLSSGMDSRGPSSVPLGELLHEMIEIKNSRNKVFLFM